MKEISGKDLRNLEKEQTKLTQANKKLDIDLHSGHPNPKLIAKDCKQIIKHADSCEKLAKKNSNRLG